jgi:crotonobetainyl-CoA:carnitine CoA-transferase CaiB-like acyl-CoA transferase
MMLADQGADVIKVEQPGCGDGVRAMGVSRSGISPLFATSNRSKRSIVIDLKADRGIELLKQLTATADVFVQNFRPGTVDRLGIDEAKMREVKPDLIYVSINGVGEIGPYAHKRVYDPVIQALSGLASIQGDRATGRPRMVRTIVSDKVTAVTAAQAMTAALLARERTGKGQHVQLAMLDAVVSFLWPEGMASHTFISDDESEPSPGDAPVRDLVFETADGYITAGAVSDREWAGLARAVGHEEWIDDPRFCSGDARVANWDERLEVTEEAFRSDSTAAWIERLDAEQVPCAPILGKEDLLTDPQILANRLIVESEHPVVGRMRETRPAARFEQTPVSIQRPAPTLGQDTDEVLRELGLAETEISMLRESDVVA